MFSHGQQNRPGFLAKGALDIDECLDLQPRVRPGPDVSAWSFGDGNWHASILRGLLCRPKISASPEPVRLSDFHSPIDKGVAAGCAAPPRPHHLIALLKFAQQQQVARNRASVERNIVVGWEQQILQREHGDRLERE